MPPGYIVKSLKRYNGKTQRRLRSSRFFISKARNPLNHPKGRDTADAVRR